MSKLKCLISLGAIIIAVIRVIFPDIKIDSVTVALFVIAILPWLAPLLKSLELPGGLKLEFLTGQPAEQQRSRLEEEVKADMKVSNKQPATEGAEDVKKLRTTHILAEDLVMRLLDEEEFSGNIRRQVTIKGRSDLAFDGGGFSKNGITLIEVKYTRTPHISNEVMDALRSRLQSAMRAVDDYSIKLLLAIVTDMQEDDRLRLESSVLNTRKTKGIDVRVYDFSDLKLRFGIND